MYHAYKRFVVVILCLFCFLVNASSSHALVCNVIFSATISHSDSSLSKWIQESLQHLTKGINQLKQNLHNSNKARNKIHALVQLILDTAEKSNKILAKSKAKTDAHIHLHEFRNALSVLIGMLEELKETYNYDALSEKRSLIIEKIIFFVTLLKDITLDNQSSVQPSSKESHTIEQSIAQIVALATYAVSNDPHIKIITSIPQATHPVMINPLEIVQVMLNLIINAQHAMPQGGKITITAENKEVFIHHHLEAGSYVVVNVHDTGSGIEPQYINRIFDPHFTTKAQGKGSGIGLSTAKQIIENHSGYIEVSSQINKGTTFTIYLPAKPVKALQKKTGKTILLLEDTPTIAELIITVLTRLGFKIVHVTSGEEALDAYNTSMSTGHSFDALITDYSVPGMNGIEVARSVSSLTPGIPIILMSAWNDPEGEFQTAPSFSAIIKKPFAVDLFSETVMKVFNGETLH